MSDNENQNNFNNKRKSAKKPNPHTQSVSLSKTTAQLSNMNLSSPIKSTPSPIGDTLLEFITEKGLTLENIRTLIETDNAPEYSNLEIMDGFDDDILELLDSKISLFSFLGFDFQIMHSKLMKKEPNKLVFTQDMIDLCLLYLLRGTNLQKIIKRTDPEGVKKVQAYINKYGLVSKVAGNAESITLSRISHTYPLITYKILLKHPELADQMGTDLPSRFCFSGSASLMSPPLYEKQKTNLIKWTEALRERIKGPKVDTKLFVEAAFTSNCLINERRLNE